MSITLDEARRVCDAGVAKSQELGYLIGIAVLDSALEIKAFRRMDGAGAHNFDISYRMAYTAGLFKRTGEEMAGMQSRGWFQALSVARGGKIAVAMGCLPIRRGDQVIGSVGVSGAPDAIDLEVAQAAIAALG